MWILNLDNIEQYTSWNYSGWETVMCHISNIDNTNVFIFLLRHTKTTGTTKNPTNMHSSDQSLRQSAQQLYFSSSDAPVWEVFLSTAVMGLWTFTSTRIVTHTHHLQCADCGKAWVRMAGGSDNVSSQRYPVSQSGVIISWLMVKWCSLCQEHRENECLVSRPPMMSCTIRSQRSFWNSRESAEEWWLLYSVNILRLSHA